MLTLHPQLQYLISSHIPSLHGFSTTVFGDMRKEDCRQLFLKVLGKTTDDLIWPEQTHGTDIAVVTAEERGKRIPVVDGLVYRRKKGDPSVVLAVHTADCTPILAIDPKKEIIGVVHAGWKGTVGHATKKLLAQMVQLGGAVSDIRVCIGPRIGSCCYDIDESRKNIFVQEFGEEVITAKHGKIFVDIGKANYLDSRNAGISEEHIDVDTSWCTSCQKETMFSYRRNGKTMTGEMVSVIGY